MSAVMIIPQECDPVRRKDEGSTRKRRGALDSVSITEVMQICKIDVAISELSIFLVINLCDPAILNGIRMIKQSPYFNFLDQVINNNPDLYDADDASGDEVVDHAEWNIWEEFDKEWVSVLCYSV